jgi:hypothetical protein
VAVNALVRGAKDGRAVLGALTGWAAAVVPLDAAQAFNRGAREQRAAIAGGTAIGAEASDITQSAGAYVAGSARNGRADFWNALNQKGTRACETDDIRLHAHAAFRAADSAAVALSGDFVVVAQDNAGGVLAKGNSEKGGKQKFHLIY